MDPKKIAEANFDFEASRIEAAINELHPAGSYSWSRKLHGGEEEFLPTDLLGGVPLFIEPSCMPSVQILEDSSRDEGNGAAKSSEDIGNAVDSVIDSMSPSNSLRLSKEIVKNELSSWISGIEDEEKKDKVEEYIMSEGGSNSISERISENVFEYLAWTKGAVVGDDKEDNVMRIEPTALTHITSVHVSASTSSDSSEDDSRVTVEKGEDDDESELGFFRLAGETTHEFIEYGRQSPVVAGDDEDEVNLGERIDVGYGGRGDAPPGDEDEGVCIALSASESEDEAEDLKDAEATPGPTFLAAASSGGILLTEEARGSVSISLNTIGDLDVSYGESSPEGLSVSDSFDHAIGKVPVQSLTPQDLARLEKEERWLEQAIEERIAFLKR